jgi:outer membrane protein TolC
LSHFGVSGEVGADTKRCARCSPEARATTADNLPTSIPALREERKHLGAWIINFLPIWMENLVDRNPAPPRYAPPQAAIARSLKSRIVLLWLVVIGQAFLQAQSPSQTAQGPSRPTPLPLSGRDAAAGSVSLAPAPAAAGTDPGSDANSALNVSAPFSGSAAQARLQDGVLSLHLEDALKMAFAFNLGMLNQSAGLLQSRGQLEIAKSELLPNVSSAISEVLERLNLRTVGVESNTFPETATFNYFDARIVRLRQTLVDLVQVENVRAARQNVNASLQMTRNAHDLVVLAVAGTYMELLATRARITASEAEVETSRTIYQQAEDRHGAGLAARIDVTRSQVQLQVEEQRLRSLQASLETQRLRFARIIGLALGQAFTLTDEYPYVRFTEFSVDAALQRALQNRFDLKAAAAGVKAAESAVKAAHAERWPNLSMNGDFGAAGLTPSRSSSGVYSIAATLAIPIYEGGRIRGDTTQANAALQERRSEFADLRGQVDQDVRQAFIEIRLADDQVEVAKSNVDLAHETLAESRDRFNVGVADTVELVQSEQAVVQADDDYISAVLEHNLAKVALARALGDAEGALPQLLRK